MANINSAVFNVVCSVVGTINISEVFWELVVVRNHICHLKLNKISDVWPGSRTARVSRKGLL